MIVATQPEPTILPLSRIRSVKVSPDKKHIFEFFYHHFSENIVFLCIFKFFVAITILSINYFLISSTVLQTFETNFIGSVLILFCITCFFLINKIWSFCLIARLTLHHYFFFFFLIYHTFKGIPIWLAHPRK